ncbi:MAG: glucokinase [Myxococcota bacterium]|jgi:glucokinase
MKRFVGIDVGGTRIKAGLVDENHQIVNEEVVWLEEGDKTEDGLLARLVEIARKVQDKHDVVSVGLGVPGVVHHRNGSVLRSPNFAAFSDFRIKERLEPLLGEKVLLDNDANCVVAGEFLHGQVAQSLAAKGSRDLIGFTMGTGVGGAIIQHGSLWRGANGLAGELGHIVIDPQGHACGCGSRGCLEMHASSVGLRALCTDQPVADVDTASADLPRLLAQKAEAGDETAQAHFATAGTAFGRALGGLSNIFEIKTVLVAGGLSPSFKWMEPAARAELARCSFHEISHDLEIVLGSLDEKAGVLGAAMQWMMAPRD